MADKPNPPGASTAAKPKDKAPADTTEKKDSKPRAPRQDYGFKAGAKITITEDGTKKTYRGKRKEYFERLEAADGKTVEEFFAACPEGDPPRGWLRFFVQDGAATLSGGKDPEPSKKDEGDKKAA